MFQLTLFLTISLEGKRKICAEYLKLQLNTTEKLPQNGVLLFLTRPFIIQKPRIMYIIDFLLNKRPINFCKLEIYFPFSRWKG